MIHGGNRNKAPFHPNLSSSQSFSQGFADNQDNYACKVGRCMEQFVGYLPYHVIMLLCHPSLGNRKICHPLATLCLPRVKLSTHGPPYAALGLHYATLEPPALWRHNATLWQHNVSPRAAYFPLSLWQGWHIVPIDAQVPLLQQILFHSYYRQRRSPTRFLLDASS